MHMDILETALNECKLKYGLQIERSEMQINDF